MVKSNKGSPKKDKKSKGKTKDKTKVAPNKVKPSVQDPELIKSSNIDDSQWKCTVAMVILPSQHLYETLLPQLEGQADISVIMEKSISEPPEGRKSRKGSRNTSKSLGSAKSSKKSTVKTKKKHSSRSKSIKLTQSLKEEQLPCTKTCFSLKKRIIDIKESNLRDFHNKQSLEESEKIVHQQIDTGKELVNAEINELNSGKNSIALHRFIILWGFYDPKIPEELAKFMIPLKAIIHVKEPDPVRSSTNQLYKNGNKKANKKKSVGTKKPKPVNNKLSSDYSIFVDEMTNNINDHDYLQVNKDFIFINFTANDKEVDNFTISIMNLLHYIKESWGKYEQYYDSIKIQRIPQSDEKLELHTAELYNTLVSLVPLECINIPVIIHSMVEQVVWWLEEKPSSHTSFPVSENMIREPTKPSNESLLRHLITKNLTPVIIDERDEIKLNTFHLHLPEFDFEEISTNMYTRSPIYNLWKIYPAQTHARSTWFEFQLQKLKNLNDKCYLNQNKHYLHHLHLFLINTFIMKLYYVSESQYHEESKLLDFEETNDFLFSEKKTQVIDKHGIIFVNLFMDEVLGKVFHQRTNQPKSYSQIAHSEESQSSDSVESERSRLSDKPKWYETNHKTEDTPTETLLHEKACYKREKLNRLKSFLLCSEFVGLYEEISKLENEAIFNDCLNSYDFIEELDHNIMAQTLQNAFHTFTNVNYEYFAPTDTILLWFNRICGSYLTTEEKIDLVLDTPIGFRDFYKFKLKGKTNWIETENINQQTNTPGDSQEKISYHRFDNTPKLNCTVYDLGPSRLEVSETLFHFDSPDSSQVLIKKFSYFDNRKGYFNVEFVKNCTTMSYEIDPDIDSKDVNVRITFFNEIFANCTFTLRPPNKKTLSEDAGGDKKNNSPLQQTKVLDEEFELDYNLSISLPSGLLIEIVPTDSDLGPFYIKQRYLSKGPECNNIWGEAYRCYFKNGTVMIFRNDGSIDVLYSNGTKVTCSSIETVEEAVDIPEEQVTKEDDLTLHKKGTTNKKLKENTLKGAKPKSKKGTLSQKKKQKLSVTKQKSIDSIVKENILIANKPKLYKKSVKISDHSVLCANGECSTFKNGVEIKKESIYTLRMGFDCLNQELYLQRSDGQSSLFTSKSLTTLYGDGSKITSYFEDDKKLRVYDLNFQLIHNTPKAKQSIYQHSVDQQSIDQQSIKSDNILFMREQIENKEDKSVNSYNLDSEEFVFIETKYDLEHNNYATVKFSNGEDITEILLPGEIKVKIDDKKLFTIYTDNGDEISLKEDNSLYFQANVFAYSLKQSRSVIKFINFENHPRIISQTLDSFDNELSIDDRGNASLLRCDNEFDKFGEICGPPRYPENVHRFFVLQRDLTGYEIIHNKQTSKYFDTHETDKHSFKVPLIKENNDLFTIYTQKPTNKNKSQEYLMPYQSKTNLPSMMKRKDLLKGKEMPDVVWFHNTSSVTACKLSSTRLHEPMQTPKAMVTSQKTKIKISEHDLMSTFYTSLMKYMNSSEQLYNTYKEHYVKDVRKDEVYMEGEQLKRNLFGSTSYQLVDNLPAVTIGDVINLHQYPDVTIEDIVSSYQITS